MNKAILGLTLICGFLLGVVAAPWIRPQQMAAPPAETASIPQPVAVAPAPPPPPAAPAPAPPPEPELILKGVFVGTEASRSRALIAQGENNARLYKVDDKLPNGYVLKAVNSKDVEIEKNGDTVNLPLLRASTGPESSLTAEEQPVAPVPEEPAAGEAKSPETPVPAENPPAATPGQES